MNPSPDLELDLADDDEEEINRVRAARRQIWESFGRDPYRLVNHYIPEQEKAKAGRTLAPETQPGGAD
jgi:hypothetical protein